MVSSHNLPQAGKLGKRLAWNKVGAPNRVVVLREALSEVVKSKDPGIMYCVPHFPHLYDGDKIVPVSWSSYEESKS